MVSAVLVIVVVAVAPVVALVVAKAIVKTLPERRSSRVPILIMTAAVAVAVTTHLGEGSLGEQAVEFNLAGEEVQREDE